MVEAAAHKFEVERGELMRLPQTHLGPEVPDAALTNAAHRSTVLLFEKGPQA